MIDEQDQDADVDVFEQSEAVKEADLTSRWVKLPASSMLSLEDADQLLRWRDASVIAIVGERNSGKTTLVTEIYGKFLRGPFADTLFCHSLSLLGFERKSFQSRAESGREYPDTPRTSAQEGLSFFHLALSNESDLLRQDLLIAERAGEVYREIRDNPDQAKDILEVIKARTVVFIIDGERVSSARKRYEVFASVRNIIRAFVGAGNVSSSAQIQLVTTKCDLLDGESMSTARDALSSFEQSIVDMLEGKFQIDVFRTIARNPHSSGDYPHGLTPLLKGWLKSLPLIKTEKIKLPELEDEFDRLLTRRAIQ